MTIANYCQADSRRILELDLKMFNAIVALHYKACSHNKLYKYNLLIFCVYFTAIEMSDRSEARTGETSLVTPSRQSVANDLDDFPEERNDRAKPLNTIERTVSARSTVS